MSSINWFFISSLSLVITTLFLIITQLKYGKEKIHWAWTLLNIAVFIWGLGAAISATISSNYHLCTLIWRLTSIGINLISVFTLYFVSLLTGKTSKIILFFSYFQAFVFTILSLDTYLIINNDALLYFNTLLVPSPGKLYLLWFFSWCFIIAYSYFYLVKFYLNQKNREKKQLKLLIFSLIVGSTCGTINFLYFLNLPVGPFANFGISLYCLMATYAVFKHQTLGIEIIYKKGLLYSILIAVLTGIYLLLIIIIESLFRGIIGYKSFILSLSSAFLIALLFNPLRNKIQLLVDKIFLGKTFQEVAQENELLKQELERSERLKAASTLALGLCHEIKNPLSTLKTFAEFVPEKHLDKNFINKFSKLVPTEIDRINNIVHKLLDFSKPTPPALQEVNIQQLFVDILDLFSSDLLKHKIKITELFENSEFKLMVDPNQLKQVLLNLLNNAKEAMPNGGMIKIGTRKINNDFVEIEIADQGIGIQKENLRYIFDPFFSTKDDGTGLGLAISYQIIKNHNGTIVIESEENKGTTVRIKLPIAF